MISLRFTVSSNWPIKKQFAMFFNCKLLTHNCKLQLIIPLHSSVKIISAALVLAGPYFGASKVVSKC